MALTNTMLRCFAAVAESGNLADAGARLGRTPSAISMTLKQMEDHLGARLFETDRKNRLTPLGEEIFGLAQQQVRQNDEAIETIETMARAPKGLLRIASIPSAVHQGLPQAVEIMMTRRPSLRIEIRDADTDIVKSALLRGQVEMGIVSGAPDLNGLRRVPLFEDAFGLVAAPDHPLMRQVASPEIADLATREFLRNDLCAQIKMPAFQEILDDTRIAARNTLSLISMVRTGNWITVLPSSVVGILPVHLTFRKIAGLDQNRVVSLLFRERCLSPDLVQEFTDILGRQSWNNSQGKFRRTGRSTPTREDPAGS